MAWNRGFGLAEPRVSALLFILAVQVGCGSDNPGASPGGASGASGASASGGTGGSSGSASGSAGTGGGAGAAGGGSGSGGLGADCTSTSFGAASTVLDEDPTYLASSPTVRGDELELLYARTVEPYDASGTNTWHFQHSLRVSTDAHFPAGSVVTELDAACAVSDSRTIDLSPDGLTAYLVCYPDPGNGETVGTLRIAKRASLSEAFVLDAMSYGETGPSATPSADGLTVYTTWESVTSQALLEFNRSALSAAFGAGTPVPGLESQALTTPDIAPDGLWLYANMAGVIVGAQRASNSAAFSPPIALLTSTVDAVTFASPKMAQSCHTLYVVASLAGTPTTHSVQQASR